jgi:serine protease Do
MFGKLKKIAILILLLLSVISPINSEDNTANYINIAKSLSKAFENAAKVITPSLVNISSLKKIEVAGFSNDPRLELFREFFGDEMFRRHFQIPKGRSRSRQGLVPNGMGSGFIWNDKGYIITNNHVIDGADQVKVKLQDKTEHVAKVIGTDPQTDIAVLKIDANSLIPVKIGDSEKLFVGEWVIAAGSPFGLEHSITTGIVSAKGRAVSRGEQYEDFIQTDAAINVGNSGGPLLNLDGEVVGINTMILSKSGGSHGIGFAIPINMATNIAEQLVDNGEVERGWLGIAIQDLTEDLRNSFSFSGEGVLIGDVNSGSPAEEAGLQSGDIVIELDGKVMNSANQFRNIIASTRPGSSLNLKLIRSGHNMEMQVRLGKKPGNIKKQQAEMLEATNGTSIENIGLEVIDLKNLSNRKKYSKTKGNVIVINVESMSISEMSGLQTEDIILKLNDIDINSAVHLKELIKESDLKKGIRLLVETDNMKRFIFLKKQ